MPATKTKTRPRCNSCEQLRINGTVCHETGCPNQNAKWDFDRECWVKYRECFECGDLVEVGESCDCQSEVCE